MEGLEIKKPMTSVHLRLPEHIRQKAREIAERETTEDQKVYEASVYRFAIEKFFREMTTKCSQ